MGRGWALVALAIILSLSMSYSISPSDYATATISMGVYGTGTISGQYTAVNFTTILIPKSDGRQSVTCSVPAPDGIARFSWGPNDPIIVNYTCVTVTKRVETEFDGKEPFPLQQQTNTSLAPFLSSSEKVLINPETSLLAQSITSGSSTEFEALVRIGRWVNSNIVYNGAYYGKRLTSAQVLVDKQGVCEEFAHLFIALARSVGIPARYVGGYAWGGSGAQGFGPHGWAEAYFPGAGWVPFDPTTGFAEWGYLDAGHIKLYTGTDAAKSVEQVSYQFYGAKPPVTWKGINPTAPDFEVVSGSGDTRDFSVESLSITPQISPSSSPVLAQARIRSLATVPLLADPNLIYQARNFADADNLHLLNETLLPIIYPGSSATINFLLMTPQVQDGSYYQFPIGLALGQKETDSAGTLEVRSSASSSSAIVRGDYVDVLAPNGDYKLVEISDGFEKRFSVSGGSAEVSLAGFSGGEIYSTSGAYFSIPGKPAGLSVTVPSEAYQDETVLNATIYSPDAVTAKVGGNTYSIPAGGGTIPVPADPQVRITIVQKNGTQETVTKTVNRIPRAVVKISLPEKITSSGSMADNIATVENGKITMTSFSAGDQSTIANSIFLKGGSCSTLEVSFEVRYEDLAGRVGILRGTQPVEVECGFSVFRAIGDFFGWLFSKG